MASAASALVLPVSLQASTGVVGSSATALHLLPFHIQPSHLLKQDGKHDKLAHYFDPTQATSSNDPTSSSSVMTAYFRGRLLKGTVIDLPAGYAGQIWKSNGPSIVSNGGHAERREGSSSINRKRGIGQVEEGGQASLAYSDPSGLRRSPRKHGKQEEQAKKPKKQQKTKQKRMKFAMSPDSSPEKVIVRREQVEKLQQEEAEDAVTPNDEKERVVKESPVKDTDDAHLASQFGRQTTPPPLQQQFTPLQIPSTPIVIDVDSEALAISTPPPQKLETCNPETPYRDGQSLVDLESLPGGEETKDLDVERKLECISTFQSFTLWNPDTAPDLGGDEYVRAISEWTAIAEAVSRRVITYERTQSPLVIV